MTITTARLQQIAAMHEQHARDLEDLVARRAHTSPQTIEDACSYAWMQLITHTDVDLRPPRWSALAWLTQTAMHEAWRLEAKRARDELLDDHAVQDEQRRHDHTDRDVDELVARRLRLDLVSQLPERSRRFLLRLAVGFNYREIAAQENVSLTTTNKQIQRAKRLLRALEAETGEGGEERPPKP